MPAPALVSTSTLWPWWISSRTEEGTRPTRYSWVLIYLGTPISMMVSRHRKNIGARYSWAELGPTDRSGRYHGRAGEQSWALLLPVEAGTFISTGTVLVSMAACAA